MKITESTTGVGTLNIGQSGGTLNIGQSGRIDSASTRYTTLDVNNLTGGSINDTSQCFKTLSIDQSGSVDYTGLGYISDQPLYYDGTSNPGPYTWYYTVPSLNVNLPKDVGPQVVFKHTKKGKVSVVLPLQVDTNFPIAGWFNTKKKTTVLQFEDGKKVKVSANPDKMKTDAHTGIIIALAKRILRKETLGDIYDRFGSDEAAEGYLFGIVEGYFVTQHIVPNVKYFNIWLSHFMTEVLVTQSKVTQSKKKEKMKKAAPSDLITEDQLDEYLDKYNEYVIIMKPNKKKQTKKEDK